MEMEFSCGHGTLLSVLAPLCGVIPRNATGDALNGVLLEADADNLALTLTASNLETTIRCETPAAVRVSGKAVIPGPLLESFLRLVDGDIAEFKFTDNCGIIKCSPADFTFKYLPADKFPALPELEPQDPHVIKNLDKLFEKTGFAVAMDRDADALKCIQLSVSQGTVVATGCNASKLAMAIEPFEGGAEMSFLIPAVPLRNMLRALRSWKSEDDAVSLSICKKHLVLQKKGITVAGRLAELEYPDTKRVIAGINWDYSAVLPAGDLLEALKQVSALGSGDITVSISFAEDGLLIKGASDNGEANISVKADIEKSSGGKAIHQKLNGLISALRTMQEPIRVLGSSKGMLMLQAQTHLFYQTGVRKPGAGVKPHKATKKVA